MSEPIIRVYFETPSHSFAYEVATFTEEKYFDACYPLLEKIAEQEGCVMTESFDELYDEDV
jgi:hypothetical protein